MTTPDQAARHQPGVGPIVVGVLSGIAHLVPGFFIVVSGLVAPLWAIIFMLAVWIAMGVAIVRMVRRGWWWTPVVPIVAMGFWFGFITLGEKLLGWQA
jgi:hypothetical protein